MSLVFVHLCADIWITVIKYFVWAFHNFVHVSVKQQRSIQLGWYILTCFINYYYVNKDTPFLLFMCIQPSKYF